MDIKEIMEIIPHRHPFLLIDKVTYLEPGKKVSGYKNVTMNEEFFKGHYPDYPVMPGVLIIESLAQLGAVALLSLPELKGKMPLFGGIDKARFKKQVHPGDTLKLEVEIVKLKSKVGIGKGIAYVEDKKACEAEFMFVIA